MKMEKRIPPIDWDATHWYNLVSSEHLCAEPPICKDTPTEDLIECQANNTLLNLPDLPAHSQSVERGVKLVTEASHGHYGYDNRHKAILAKITSRKMRPMFTSKGSYSQAYDSLL